MSDTPHSPGAGPLWTGLEVTPVLPDDPAKVGSFWLDGRLASRPSGTAWLAHSDGLTDDSGDVVPPVDERVVVVQLAEGAAADKSARDRFSGLVNHLHIDAVVARGGQDQDRGRLGKRFRSTAHHPVPAGDAPPLAPWVALAYADDPGVVHLAENMLAEVDLLDLPALGQPAGPGFQLPWIERSSPGHTRIWPLPWPGRYDRAGWVTILISWLLMLLLAAIAVLIAILLFRDSPPQTPPPQAETTAAATPPATPSPEPSPSDTPPASPEPTPPDGSPSPTEGSPTPQPTGTAPGTPTPPSRL